ncbi:MAG: hypothetical protein NTW33_10285 [Methanoregula sp.]|nr:hypothetical protein [Methanoregula sp.]
MAKKCSICQSPHVSDINRALVKGGENGSCRDLALQYHVGHMSLHRHQKAGHIPASIVKAEEAKEIAKGNDLLKYVRGLLGKSVRILDSAEGSGDLRTACSAIREARGCLELLGKVTGELTAVQTAVQVNVSAPSIMQAPEWSVLVRVLSGHPEIRAELDQALSEAGL